MTQTRCTVGDMGRVARSTTGCGCTVTAVAAGLVIYCSEPSMSCYGPAWLLKTPRRCAECGRAIFGYLDADLDPIKPPPLARSVDTAQPREVVA